jgi:pilus assembly protein Flp/PilA
MSKFIKNFVRDERGITAIEYAIMAGLIAIALALSVGKLTTGIDNAFQAIATKISPPT